MPKVKKIKDQDKKIEQAVRVFSEISQSEEFKELVSNEDFNLKTRTAVAYISTRLHAATVKDPTLPPFSNAQRAAYLFLLGYQLGRKVEREGS